MYVGPTYKPALNLWEQVAGIVCQEGEARPFPCSLARMKDVLSDIMNELLIFGCDALSPRVLPHMSLFRLSALKNMAGISKHFEYRISNIRVNITIHNI